MMVFAGNVFGKGRGGGGVPGAKGVGGPPGWQASRGTTADIARELASREAALVAQLEATRRAIKAEVAGVPPPGGMGGDAPLEPLVQNYVAHGEPASRRRRRPRARHTSTAPRRHGTAGAVHSNAREYVASAGSGRAVSAVYGVRGATATASGRRRRRHRPAQQQQRLSQTMHARRRRVKGAPTLWDTPQAPQHTASSQSLPPGVGMGASGQFLPSLSVLEQQERQRQGDVATPAVDADSELMHGFDSPPPPWDHSHTGDGGNHSGLGMAHGGSLGFNTSASTMLPVFALPSVQDELRDRERRRQEAEAAQGAQDRAAQVEVMSSARRRRLEEEREVMRKELGLTEAQMAAIVAAEEAQGAAAVPQQSKPPPSLGGNGTYGGDMDGSGDEDGRGGAPGSPPWPSRSPAATLPPLRTGRSGLASTARRGSTAAGTQRSGTRGTQRTLVRTRSTPRVLRPSHTLPMPRGATRRRRGKRGAGAGAGGARHGPAFTAALRRELSASIAQVQQLTTAVKDDIAEVQRICPITSIRAQMFMQKWGLKKFEAIFNRMRNSFILSAWKRWKWFLAEKERAEVADKVTRFKKVRALERMIRNYEMGGLAKGFDTWLRKFRAVQAAERAVAEDKASRTIQRQARIKLARLKADRLRAANRRFEEAHAATTIQRWVRGRDATNRARAFTQRIREGEAAKQIQRIVRGKLGRRRAQRRAVYLVDSRAATQIQRIVRGKQGRAYAVRVAQGRKMDAAAVHMQRITRGFLGRARVRVLAEERARDRAARAIQALVRGRHARKKVTNARTSKAQYMKRLNEAALRVQTRWRAHKGQLSYHLKLQAKRMRDRDQAKAAVRIQAFWRGRSQGQSLLERMRADNERRIVAARQWIEFFDDHNACYYFYNELTAVRGMGCRGVDAKLVLYCVHAPNVLQRGFDNFRSRCGNLQSQATHALTASWCWRQAR